MMLRCLSGLFATGRIPPPGQRSGPRAPAPEATVRGADRCAAHATTARASCRGGCGAMVEGVSLDAAHAHDADGGDAAVDEASGAADSDHADHAELDGHAGHAHRRMLDHAGHEHDEEEDDAHDHAAESGADVASSMRVLSVESLDALNASAESGAPLVSQKTIPQDAAYPPYIHDARSSTVRPLCVPCALTCPARSPFWTPPSAWHTAAPLRPCSHTARQAHTGRRPAVITRHLLPRAIQR